MSWYASEMFPKERAARLASGLAAAKATISPHYDEILEEVAQRIEAASSVGKGDIGMLVVWKRLRADTRWVQKLLGLAEERVRELTGPVVTAARGDDVIDAAHQARELLRPLPGFRSGTALASAILTAACPTRLAVYDKRARRGLRDVELELSDDVPRFYAAYMTLIEQCRSEALQEGHRWSAHDVDLALYMLGK